MIDRLNTSDVMVRFAYIGVCRTESSKFFITDDPKDMCIQVDVHRLETVARTLCAVFGVWRCLSAGQKVQAIGHIANTIESRQESGQPTTPAVLLNLPHIICDTKHLRTYISQL